MSTFSIEKAPNLERAGSKKGSANSSAQDHNGVIYLMDKRGKFISTFNLERPPPQAARELEGYL
jgi:cytochrome oxidase Cu insertion factor (SCO1/SenC/PrrC family)